MKSSDNSLPQVLLTVLGPADRLQHVVELVHASRNHAECIAGTAHDADKVVVVRRRDMMQTSLRTHAEPIEQSAIRYITVQQTD